MRRPYGYGRDPLFWGALLLYGVNRSVLRLFHIHHGFMSWHFNDLLLVPCALPPLLWVYRFLGVRTRDIPPTGREILFHVVIWSVLFEGLFPLVSSRGTADIKDVVAYAVGGALSWGIWQLLAAGDVRISFPSNGIDKEGRA